MLYILSSLEIVRILVYISMPGIFLILYFVVLTAVDFVIIFLIKL